jgi:hypothetical protein
LVLVFVVVVVVVFVVVVVVVVVPSLLTIQNLVAIWSTYINSEAVKPVIDKAFSRFYLSLFIFWFLVS